MSAFEQIFNGASVLSGDANNDIALGTDGGLFLQETETTLAYNAGTTTLTYTNEAGTATNVDLSALTTDIFVNGATFNAASSVLTLTDNDGVTGDVTIDLSTLQGSVTDNADGTYSYLNGDGTTPAVVIDTRAASNSIADAGGIITATTVEGALQEIAAELDGTLLTLAGDAGTAQALTLGNTITVAGGDLLATTASATDTVTLGWDAASLAAGDIIQSDGTTMNVLNIGTAGQQLVVNAAGDALEYVTAAAGTFTLAGDTGSETITLGADTITVGGGTNGGIVTAVTATDALDITLDINDLVASTDVAPLTDSIAFYDASAGTNNKVLISEVLTDSVMDDVVVDGTTGQLRTGGTLTQDTDTNLGTSRRRFSRPNGNYVEVDGGVTGIVSSSAGTQGADANARLSGTSLFAEQAGNNFTFNAQGAGSGFHFVVNGDTPTTEGSMNLSSNGTLYIANSVTSNEVSPDTAFSNTPRLSVQSGPSLFVNSVGGNNGDEIIAIGTTNPWSLFQDASDPVFRPFVSESTFSFQGEDSADLIEFKSNDADTGFVRTNVVNLYPVRTETADYTATTADSRIFVDSSAGAVTITLPSAVTYPGAEYHVKVTDNTNQVSVTAAAGNVENVATYALATAGLPSYTICSNGTDRYII